MGCFFSVMLFICIFDLKLMSNNGNGKNKLAFCQIKFSVFFPFSIIVLHIIHEQPYVYLKIFGGLLRWSMILLSLSMLPIDDHYYQVGGI